MTKTERAVIRAAMQWYRYFQTNPLIWPDLEKTGKLADKLEEACSRHAKRKGRTKRRSIPVFRLTKSGKRRYRPIVVLKQVGKRTGRKVQK